MKVSGTSTAANFASNLNTHTHRTLTTEITEVVQTDTLPNSVLKPEKISLSELSKIAPSYSERINSGKKTLENLEMLFDNVSISDLVTTEAKDIKNILEDNSIFVSMPQLSKALSTMRAAEHTSAVRSIQITWRSITQKEGIASTTLFSADRKKELLKQLLTKLDKRKKKLQLTPALVRYALLKAETSVDCKINWLSALIPSSSKPKKVGFIVAGIRENLKTIQAIDNEQEQLEAVQKLAKTAGCSGNSVKKALKITGLKISPKQVIRSHLPKVKLTHVQKKNYLTSKKKTIGKNETEKLESQLSQKECQNMNFVDLSHLLDIDGKDICPGTIQAALKFSKVKPTTEQENIVMQVWEGIVHDPGHIHETDLITLLILLKPKGIDWMVARKVLWLKSIYIPKKTLQQASAAANATFTQDGLDSFRKKFNSVAKNNPQLSLSFQVEKLLRKCKNLEIIGAPKIVRMLYEIGQRMTTATMNVVLGKVKRELVADKKEATEKRQTAETPPFQDASLATSYSPALLSLNDIDMELDAEEIDINNIEMQSIDEFLKSLEDNSNA